MTRISIALLLGFASIGPAAAVNGLPPSCDQTLALIQSDKPQFRDLGGRMVKYRKVSDTANFCVAARQIVVLIKGESAQVEACIGDLKNAPNAVPQAAREMTGLRSIYAQMLQMASNEKNDRFRCGLASQ